MFINESYNFYLKKCKLSIDDMGELLDESDDETILKILEQIKLYSNKCIKELNNEHEQ